MGIRVGIDLGTTFSAVAMIDRHTGKPVVIRNGFGSPVTPSVLCFQPDGGVLYGEEAKEMQSFGDTNAVAFFKRSMGKDAFSVDILGKTYTATDLSAILLQKLKEEAERQCGETIDGAVITVPAYFTSRERAATIQAGRQAGLEVLSILSEPTAAALAYGLGDRPGEQTVMIYDLGGGTFDVTLARINSNEIRILSCDGDHELGGKDWDDCIARYLADEFQEKYGMDLSEDDRMVTSLLVTAEQVKKQLTSKNTVTVPLAYKDIRGSVDITEEIFESISEFLIGTTREVTERCLSSVGMDWSGIDGVILVGGSTRMRMIRNYVREMSGKEPLSGVNVDEAVALGAAIRANITDKGEALPAIGGSAPKRAAADVVGVRGAKAVTDVTAHSLGMIAISPDGERYVNSVIIRKNTPIPSENMRPFHFRTRARDNELEVYVLQGEFERPLDNTLLNKYVITQIRKTASLEAVIQVTYRYTSNGVVEIAAIQQDSGQALPVRIEPVPEDMSWTDGSPKDRAAGESQPPIDVALAIDLSGSMSGEPTRKAMQAMEDFVDQMDNRFTRVAVFAFADSVRCLQPLSEDFTAVKKTIRKLESVDVGVCNGAHPFTDARAILSRWTSRKKRGLRYIVVLTDGCWACREAAIQAAHMCHMDGIDVMALGFGSANYEFLKQIASTDQFASLTDLSDLGGSFSRIAQAIGEGAGGLATL